MAALPDAMTAVTYNEFGGPEVLRVGQVPMPKLQQDSVLVRVMAAGLNPADAALQAGVLRDGMDTWFPVIPGWDFSGVVVEAGPGASEFAVGDEVMGFLRESILHHGTFAEYLAAPATHLVHKPDTASWEEAGALPLAGLTALLALRAAHVEKGDHLLVHGASGGVGSLVAQIASHWGVKVTGTGSDRSHEYLASLGVTPLTEDQVSAGQESSLGPYTAIIDTIGRGTTNTSRTFAVPDAPVVSIADFGPGIQTVFARLLQDDLRILAELHEEGAFRVRVGNTYPLADVAAAQSDLAARRHAGKLVLLPRIESAAPVPK